MAIELSFTIIIILELSTAALLKPSSASPPDNEPSPISATTLYFSFFKSLAFAMPEARLKEVDVCPKIKLSCGLSLGLEYPVISGCASGLTKASLRPVKILCGYIWCETSYTILS